MKIYVHLKIKSLLLKKKIKKYWNCMKNLGINEQKLVRILLIEIYLKFVKDLLLFSKMQNNNNNSN